MGIVVKTKIDFNKVKEVFLGQINKRMAKAFSLSCKEAVTYAKENKGYTTQTGALSASTGFQLYLDGELMAEYFDNTGVGGNPEYGALGINTGKKVASQSDVKNAAPIVGVIVAGMPYAIHVEANGRDVLTGATLKLPEILNRNIEYMFSGTGVSFEINA